jgi:hypothetical protein
MADSIGTRFAEICEVGANALQELVSIFRFEEGGRKFP